MTSRTKSLIKTRQPKYCRRRHAAARCVRHTSSTPPIHLPCLHRPLQPQLYLSRWIAKLQSQSFRRRRVAAQCVIRRALWAQMNRRWRPRRWETKVEHRHAPSWAVGRASQSRQRQCLSTRITTRTRTASPPSFRRPSTRYSSTARQRIPSRRSARSSSTTQASTQHHRLREWHRLRAPLRRWRRRYLHYLWTPRPPVWRRCVRPSRSAFSPPPLIGVSGKTTPIYSGRSRPPWWR